MVEKTLSLSQNNLSPDQGSLVAYLREIKKFPMLDATDEFMLAKKWVEQGDRKAAHTLVTSHLRLVAKIAAGYKGYGLPMNDLIAEGNIGLMHAVKRFDPDKGFRLSTYALWWIKAMMQEYILRSWSLVKIGTTSAQKKLFFSLKRLKNDIQSIEGESGDLTAGQIQKIATDLKISPKEISEMEQRIKGADFSLNTPLSQSDVETPGEWQDWLVDELPTAEELLVHQDEFEQRKSLLSKALSNLSEREFQIINARRLQDPPETLDKLATSLGISKERVRQIEMNAFTKLQNYMKSASEV